MSNSQFRQTFPSGLLELRDIPGWMQARLQDTGVLAAAQIEALMPKLELGVQEQCVNVVTHAYDGKPGQTLDIELTVTGERVEVVVLDDGPPFDPGGVLPPEAGELQIHGFGVGIIRALTSEYHVMRVADRNVTTMVFAVPTTPTAAAE